ncbi:MAG: DHHW family protein [Gemmiger sp.]
MSDKPHCRKGPLAYPVLIVFLMFVFGFSLFNVFWPKRENSELENRKLQQFPEFSLSGFLSGDWGEQFGAYLQDQFALRDSWINAESFLNEIVFQKVEESDILYGDDGWMFTKNFGLSDTARKQLEKNTAAVAQFGESHPGKVTFLLAPSASVIYADELPVAAPMIDENALLDEIFATVGKSAQVLDLRECFSASKDEQLFYKTDHHWTTQGAYLAYEQFCAQQGLTPFNTAVHQAVNVEDFYGTHYSSTRRWNTKAETLTYYPLPNKMTIYQANGETEFAELKSGELVNTDKLTTRDKYGAFLDGNNGYSVIEGDGEGSILVMKDSYGNCFIPFLTANYAKIGVIDFRNYKYGPDALIEMEGYDQLLVLYNFQTFTSDRDLINLIRPAAAK